MNQGEAPLRMLVRDYLREITPEKGAQGRKADERRAEYWKTMIGPEKVVTEIGRKSGVRSCAYAAPGPLMLAGRRSRRRNAHRTGTAPSRPSAGG